MITVCHTTCCSLKYNTLVVDMSTRSQCYGKISLFITPPLSKFSAYVQTIYLYAHLYPNIKHKLYYYKNVFLCINTSYNVENNCNFTNKHVLNNFSFHFARLHKLPELRTFHRRRQSSKVLFAKSNAPS